MCGIIAVLAKTSSIPALIEDLNKLGYRGWDSSDLANVNQADLIAEGPLVESLG